MGKESTVGFVFVMMAASGFPRKRVVFQFGRSLVFGNHWGKFLLTKSHLFPFINCLYRKRNDD